MFPSFSQPIVHSNGPVPSPGFPLQEPQEIDIALPSSDFDSPIACAHAEGKELKLLSGNLAMVPHLY
jgi:hypothetical protein